MKKNNCKYLENYPALVNDLARQKLNNAQIAEHLEISASTFYKWLRTYPELKKSLQDGRKPLDFEVENALLKRALGFDYEEFVDQSGSVKKTTRHMAPDVRAAIFWLKNRRPELWNEDLRSRKKSTGKCEIEKFRVLVDSMTHAEKLKLLRQLVDKNEQASGD